MWPMTEREMGVEGDGFVEPYERDESVAMTLQGWTWVVRGVSVTGLAGGVGTAFIDGLGLCACARAQGCMLRCQKTSSTEQQGSRVAMAGRRKER